MVRASRTIEDRLARPSPKLTQLIDTAAQLFYDKGYQATSMRDIADELGILKGSLYSHIDSKDDLLYGISSRVQNRFAVMLDELRWEPTLSPTNRLRRLFARHLELMMSGIVESRVYDRHFSELSDLRRQALQLRRDAYRRALVEMIEDAQRSGEIDGTRNAAQMALFVTSSLNSINEWYKPRGAVDPAMVAEYTSILVSGVTGSLDRT